MSNAGVRIRSGGPGIIPGAPRLVLPRGLDPTALEWCHFFTHGLVNALRNWAPGKQDAIVRGNPIEQAGYLQLKSGTNYLELDLTDTGQAITRIIGGRDIGTQADNANRFMWGGAGFAGSPTVAGMTIYTNGANSLLLSARYTDGAAPVTRSPVLAVPGGVASPMRLVIASAGAVGITESTADDVTIDEYITGLSATGGLNTGYARMATGNKFMCGHGTAGNLTGSGHVWCDIGFSRVLTAMEKLIVRNWLLAIGRAHGIYP